MEDHVHVFLSAPPKVAPAIIAKILKVSVQLTRDEVIQAYKSFFELRKKGLTQHHAPGFRKKCYLSPLKYVQSGFKVEGKKVTLSLEPIAKTV
jgi:REP element-mobilizing transposase RayT